ncbi:MAG: hypothetical protein FWJ72_17210, partial [Acidimicrobiia bacterium]
MSTTDEATRVTDVAAVDDPPAGQAPEGERPGGGGPGPGDPSRRGPLRVDQRRWLVAIVVV